VEVPSAPPRTRERERRRALVLLVVLSPTIAEFLTGSTPITGLVLNPLGFVIPVAALLGLYGAGVVLVRELVVRWRKGWASVFLLGAAYGILEEGIAVHTFFQPGGNPVGALGSYGRALGVNWVWAVGLTLFHAAYSIALPILLVRLVHPALRSEPWVTDGQLRWTGGFYVTTVVLLFAAVGSKPGPALLGLFLAIVACFVAAARWAPANLLEGRPGAPTDSGFGFAFAGAVLFSGWILLGGILEHVVPAWLTLLGLLAVAGLSAVWVLLRVGTRDHEWQLFGWASGMLVPLFLWDVVLEFVRVPGLLAVTAGMLVFAIWLGRKIRRAAGASRGPSLGVEPA
jgi:hypothetical protein